MHHLVKSEVGGVHMDDRWWREWIGPCVFCLLIGVFFSVLHQSWEFVLVMAGGLAAGLWYEWDCRRKGS